MNIKQIFRYFGKTFTHAMRTGRTRPSPRCLRRRVVRPSRRPPPTRAVVAPGRGSGGRGSRWRQAPPISRWAPRPSRSRVALAPAALECKLTQILQLPGEANFAVFGEVIGVHLRDDCVVDGLFDVTRFNPLARLGYKDYSVVRETFSLKRPDE